MKAVSQGSGTDVQPSLLGKKYDRIAQWWQQRHDDGHYGLAQLKQAIAFRSEPGQVLDVGCGAGGRMIRVLQHEGYRVCGIDVSEEMIKLAQQNHPDEEFHVQDICTWEPQQRRFELIVAWDSIFHLPLALQEPVLAKLCGLLADGGVLFYSFGDAIGDHEDQWHDDNFYYSSIGISENLRLLDANGLVCKHLELDQFPANHVYVIAIKPEARD